MVLMMLTTKTQKVNILAARTEPLHIMTYDHIEIGIQTCLKELKSPILEKTINSNSKLI